MPLHNRLSIQGTLPGGEVWSCNPRYMPGENGVPINEYAELLDWAQGVAALNGGTVLPLDVLSLFGDAVVITTIRTEYIGTEGQLLQAAEVNLADPIEGVGNATKPFQTSTVTSLLTGRPGRSYRGRLYWPTLAMPVSTTTLRIPSSTRDQFATQMAEFLSDTQQGAFAGAPLRLAVVSQTQNTMTPVTQIQVGDVLDVQRRRRDSLTEQRITVALP